MTEEDATVRPHPGPSEAIQAPYRPSIGDHIRGFIWGVSEPFRTDKTPAWASLVALFIAVAPGLSQRLDEGAWGEYDPTIAVLTATLIALIWTAHYTFRAVRHARQAEERAELRRRLTRASIAAAVSAELDWLQPSLAILRARIHTREVSFLERPRLQDALSNLDLFSSASATSLSEFDAILQQIESQCALYGAEHEAAEHAAIAYQYGSVLIDPLRRDPNWVETIRKFIDTAQELIPHLKNQLLQEI
jgi:hypothetical protein